MHCKGPQAYQMQQLWFHALCKVVINNITIYGNILLLATQITEQGSTKLTSLQTILRCIALHSKLWKYTKYFLGSHLFQEGINNNKNM